MNKKISRIFSLFLFSFYIQERCHSEYSNGLFVEAITNVPGFHFPNRHKNPNDDKLNKKTNVTRINQRNHWKTQQWFHHLNFLTKTKQKIKGMVVTASTDSSPSSTNDMAQTVLPPSTDTQKSVHLELGSDSMKSSMRDSNKDEKEKEVDPNDNEKKVKQVQTATLMSYIDPVTKHELFGLNIPTRKFQAWVEYTLLHMESKQTKHLDIRIHRETPPSLDINQMVTKKVRLDDEKMRKQIRQLWNSRQLISERTEILATYASDTKKSSNKTKENESNKGQKRGGFSDLLHTYAERLLAIIKDEQDDFDIYMVLENDTNMKSNTSKGTILDWLRKEYGNDEMDEIINHNLYKKPEDVQYAVLQKFLDWFRTRFPYYYDRCESCGFSEKDNPPSPIENNVDSISIENDNEEKENNDEDSEEDEDVDGVFLGYVYPTEEELKGKATRTELYWCNQCGAFSRFPRYNSASWILQKRKGRCGEYSMLLFRMLRAIGFESRWVIDWADHVWAEVKIGDKWIHTDPCEAALDKPLLYQEWGKQQNYIIAFNAPSWDYFNFIPNDLSKDVTSPVLWDKITPLVEDVTTTYTSDPIDDIDKRRDESIQIIKSSIAKVEKDLKIRLTDLRQKRMK